jgi:hypothetical protein
MLCAFFTGIGQRKKGEKVTMNWNAVVGSRGRAKLAIREWTNDKGELKRFNDVKKIYEPDENQIHKQNFTPGSF